MASIIGRPLLTSEHVHHKNKKFKTRDTAKNLELLTSVEHNRRHKTGSRHTEESKQRISDSLKKAYNSGRRKKQDLSGKKNPFYGMKHSKTALQKMIGRITSEETKAVLSRKAKQRWQDGIYGPQK